MFDFNNKSTAAGVLAGAAAIGAAAPSQAVVLVDLPDGSDTSFVNGVPAVYEFEFGPIANATEVGIQSDTGESDMFVRLNVDAGSTGEASWEIELKLDGIWEAQGPETLGPIPGPNTGIVNFSSFFNPSGGEVLTFDQAELSGIRVLVDPNITIGTGSTTVLVNNNSQGQEQLVVTVVPEPSSLALLGLGGLCLMTRRRR